jgi:hypothetical protein
VGRADSGRLRPNVQNAYFTVVLCILNRILALRRSGLRLPITQSGRTLRSRASVACNSDLRASSNRSRSVPQSCAILSAAGVLRDSAGGPLGSSRPSVTQATACSAFTSITYGSLD